MSEGQCVSLRDLAVNGKDLIEAGVQPGPQIGELLNELLEEVIEEPEKNTKGQLLIQLRQFIMEREDSCQ